MGKKKKPKTLKFNRTRNKIECSWAHGEKYINQKFQRKLVKGDPKFVAQQVGDSAKKENIIIDLDEYYPIKSKKLTQVWFRVRGKTKKKKWTGWKRKKFKISTPTAPTIRKTASTESGSIYSSTFEVTVKKDQATSKKRWVTDIEVETALVINASASKTTTPPDSAWNAIQDSEKPSIIYPENSHIPGDTNVWDKLIQEYSTKWNIVYAEDSGFIQPIIESGTPVTRYIRVRARGPAGHSKWNIGSKTYGKSLAAFNVVPLLSDNGNGGYHVSATFDYYNNNNMPVTKLIMEYCFASPGDDGIPDNPSPQEGAKVDPKQAYNNYSTGDKSASAFVDISDEEDVRTGVIEQASVYNKQYVTDDTEEIKYTGVCHGAAHCEVGSRVGNDLFLWVRINVETESGLAYGDWAMGTLADGSQPTDTILQKPTIQNVHQNPVEEDDDRVIEVTATNNCTIADSYLVVRYYPETGGYIDIGTMEGGEPEDFGIPPEGNFDIGVYAVISDEDPQVSDQGDYDQLTVVPKYKSEIALQGGNVPQPPTDIRVTNITNPNAESGQVEISFTWNNWKAANQATISWADDLNAWKADTAKTRTVYRYEGTSWVIPELELGKTWHFRVRLVEKGTGEGDSGTYSVWSPIISKDLRSQPIVPVATINPTYIKLGDLARLTWSYVSADKSQQQSVIIARADANGVITTSGGGYDEVATLGDKSDPYTEQSYTFDSNDPNLGWEVNNTYYFVIKVTSENGATSENWSAPTSVTIIEPCTAEIDRTRSDYPFETRTDTEEDPEADPYLTEMPMTIKVDGAGTSKTTELTIIRTNDLEDERPNGKMVGGYEGEIIYRMIQTGDEPITIENGDPNLIGYLNDQAAYEVHAVVSDSYGQVSEPDIQPFKVDWSHQALMPKASVESDQDDKVVYITIETPDEGTPLETDYCQIYRFSADQIELIADNCQFGETYVDPYPTLGVNGGHRIVYMTANGDYTTEEGVYAWLDIQVENFDPTESYLYGEYVLENGHVYQCNVELTEPEYFNVAHWALADDSCDYIKAIDNIIDYDGDQVMFRYNVDFTHSWKKDFTETKYLGGSVQGDWNAAVSKNATINTVVVADDVTTKSAMVEMAGYAGPCHVRTTNGYNYDANVEVSESAQSNPGLTVSYSLNITRVDGEPEQAITEAEWEDMNNEEGS